MKRLMQLTFNSSPVMRRPGFFFSREVDWQSTCTKEALVTCFNILFAEKCYASSSAAKMRMKSG